MQVGWRTDHTASYGYRQGQDMKSLTTPPRDEGLDAGVKKILASLRGLKFGSVEITVHEGRIVQIERKEKHRLSITLPDTGTGANHS